MKNTGEISQLTVPPFFDSFLRLRKNSARKDWTRVSRESRAITAAAAAAVINEPIDRRVKLMLFIFDWIEVGRVLASRVLP